jgi:uncharacterized protein
VDPLEFDCNACGACCAYAADWPTLTTERDRGPEGPPAAWVVDGHVGWAGDRCAALEGEVGACTRCRIYPRRPEPCRACEPGSVSCLVARRLHGLPVPEEPSALDEALVPTGSRPRLGRRTTR